MKPPTLSLSACIANFLCSMWIKIVFWYSVIHCNLQLTTSSKKIKKKSKWLSIQLFSEITMLVQFLLIFLLGPCRAEIPLNTGAIYRRAEIPLNKFCQVKQIPAESRLACAALCSMERNNGTSCCAATIFNETTSSCICGIAYCLSNPAPTSQGTLLMAHSACSKQYFQQVMSIVLPFY